MRSLSAYILLIVCILAVFKSFAEQANSTPNEQKALEGHWVCVGQELGGQALSKAEIKVMNRRLNINGTKFEMIRVWKNAFGNYEGRFSIDAGKNPKEFNFTGKGPGGSYIERIGIYELQADTFRLCWRDPKADAQRPTKFETAPKAGIEYFTFKRDAEMAEQARIGGIGAKLEKVDGQIRIQEIVSGGPAAKALLKSADVITAINGRPTAAMALEEAVKLVRGEVGTDLELEVKSTSTSVAQKVTLVREALTFPKP